MMIDCEVLIYIDQICNSSGLSVCLSQNYYFPPSWAPQARSEAWEVYLWELYPVDDPPRPSRPKAGLGLVMMMEMIMMKMVMMIFIVHGNENYKPWWMKATKSHDCDLCRTLKNGDTSDYDYDTRISSPCLEPVMKRKQVKQSHIKKRFKKNVWPLHLTTSL